MVLNKKEISPGRWFILKEIDQMIKTDPAQFALGFLRAYKQYLVTFTGMIKFKTDPLIGLDNKPINSYHYRV